ncbi:sugar ABC transporter permease [[Mycoplasma] mobile]|nr:hypothetical protein [[Mycoplasma] mobile]
MKQNMFNKFKQNISDSLNIFTNNIKKIKNHILKISFFIFINKYLKIGLKHFNKYSMFYILGLMVLVFSTVSIGNGLTFFSPNQFVNLLRNNSYIFIIGLPMLLVIVSGNIDLSVGRLLGFSSAIALTLFNNVTGGNIFLTIILTLLLGAGVGIIQGVMIGYYRIPAFIITLGGMLIFQGLELVLTNGQPLIVDFDTSFVQFSQAPFPDFNLGTTQNPFWIISFLILLVIGSLLVAYSFQRRFKAKKYNLEVENLFVFLIKQLFVIGLFFVLAILTAMSRIGLQLFMLYILILIILFVILTKYTKFGRSIYAIGGNRKAAELSGINAKFTTFAIFVIMGIITSFAGIIFAGNFQAAQPNGTAGFELNVISSIFIGGASVAGGIGTVIGSIMGALIIATINLGLVVNQVEAAFINIITGIVLAAAVTYDIFSKRKIG